MIGFVVPNQKHFLTLAEQYDVRGSWKELCNSKTMEELVLKAITEMPLAGAKHLLRLGAVAGVPTNVCLLLLSPAGAFRNPPQDPSEPRPMDSRDRVSDRRVQAETQGAENALPERHRADVWREISRSSAACSLCTALRLTRNPAGNISVKKRAAVIGGKYSSFSRVPISLDLEL